MFDVDNIWKTLWQGAVPPGGDLLRDKGYDVLVLAARDHQMPEMYPGVTVILAPGDDDERPHRLPRFLPVWEAAAREVAVHVRANRKVLVTCMAGANRSGMVTGLALRELTGWSGKACVAHIRSRRNIAFSNDTFRGYLESLP